MRRLAQFSNTANFAAYNQWRAAQSAASYPAVRTFSAGRAAATGTGGGRRTLVGLSGGAGDR